MGTHVTAVRPLSQLGTAPASSHDHPHCRPPPSRSRHAGRHLVHPPLSGVGGGGRRLTPADSEGPGAMPSSHSRTMPTMWVAQACSLSQVAPTPRHPWPHPPAPAATHRSGLLPTSQALGTITTRGNSALAVVGGLPGSPPPTTESVVAEAERPRTEVSLTSGEKKRKSGRGKEIRGSERVERREVEEDGRKWAWKGSKDSE